MYILQFKCKNSMKTLMYSTNIVVQIILYFQCKQDRYVLLSSTTQIAQRCRRVVSNNFCSGNYLLTWLLLLLCYSCVSNHNNNTFVINWKNSVGIFVWKLALIFRVLLMPKLLILEIVTNVQFTQNQLESRSRRDLRARE